MPIKIVLCDDAVEDIALLSSLLLAYDPSFDIVTYRRGGTLVCDFLEESPSADLLFLDIYMPGLNGIETAEKIHNRYPELKIVFISSSKDYYPQAYEVFAFNYILKPIDRERLFVVLDRAIAEMGKEQGPRIRIQYKSAVYIVDCREIQYIESRDKLLIFHLVDTKTLQCYGKQDEI